MKSTITSYYLSFATGTIEYDHYTRECEFGILKKNKKTTKKNKKNLSAVFLLNEECPKLISSSTTSLGIDHLGRKTIPLLNVCRENYFKASLYVWYLQYWALCDA